MFVWRNVNTTLILPFISPTALILSQYFLAACSTSVPWWSDRPTDPLPWQKTNFFIDSKRETTDHRQFIPEPSSLNQVMLNFMSGPPCGHALWKHLTTGTNLDLHTNTYPRTTHMYYYYYAYWVRDPRGLMGLRGHSQHKFMKFYYYTNDIKALFNHVIVAQYNNMSLLVRALRVQFRRHLAW